MAAIVATLLLALGAAGYVAWPLLAPRVLPLEEDPELDLLQEREQAAVEALRELDYERRLGKLADADYFRLRERYALQAMALLKLLDQRDAARDRVLEQSIAARRQVSRPAVGGMRAAGTATAPAAGARGTRQGRPWVVATIGGMVALLIGVALLLRTIHEGTLQPRPVGQVPLQAPRALAFDPANPGHLLAAGASGLAVSGDQGRTWTLVQTSIPAATIESLAPAPDGGGVMAIVAGRGAVLSRDGGATWTALPDAPALPAGVRAVAIVPGQPPLLVAATAAGVVISADQGRSWSSANGFVTGLLPTTDDRDVVYAPTADQSTGPQGRTFHGLLFVATRRGLFASFDGAQSWLARSLGDNLEAVAVDPQNPSLLFAMNAGGALFASHDAGATWGP